MSAKSVRTSALSKHIQDTYYMLGVLLIVVYLISFFLPRLCIAFLPIPFSKGTSVSLLPLYLL